MAGHIKIVSIKERRRDRRKTHIRMRVTGSAERPRLSVFRSAKHIYAQAIDDRTGTVLAAASDLEAGVSNAGGDKDKRGVARLVGEAVGKKLLEKNINAVVFDRNGYVYHGRIKEVADGARAAGLQF